MASLPTYYFYESTYYGTSIQQAEWVRLATRANEEVAYFERRFTVTERTGDSRNMAVCAIADAINAAEAIVSASVSSVSSVSIGSVSTAYRAPDASALGVDLTETGQKRQYYALLQKYCCVNRGTYR